VNTNQNRPAVTNTPTTGGYSRPSSDVYTKPQVPSGNFNSNVPSGQSRPERPSGNFSSGQNDRPVQPATRPAPADDYYSRPSRQERPTQNYTTPRGDFNSGTAPSGNYQPSNRGDNQQTRPGRDFSTPSNSRPGSEFSRPQPSRPSLDSPRPSNRGSYQAPSGGGGRSGGSIAPTRSAPSGGGFGGGSRSGSSGPRGGTSVGGRR
jgi:hypothetical protein